MIESFKNYSSEQLMAQLSSYENTIIEKEKIIESKERENEYLRHQVSLFQKALFDSKKETHHAGTG